MSEGGFDRLVALVANCTTAGIARQALLLRIHCLPASLTRPHHIRLAEAALAPLLRLPRAEIFHLPGPSLAVAWRGEAEAELLDVIDALEHLVSDPHAGSPALSDLVALYDLPATGDLLLGAFAALPAAAPPIAADPALPLDPAFLTLLESCLAQADVTRFARRQPVWRLGDTDAGLAWEDRTLCLSELTDALAPGYDLQAEPWLFRRLTRTLDRRLLALLASPGELASAGPFAIGLNVASLLSPDFLRFDAALPPALRGRVVVSLSAADIVADAGSVQFACGFARARFYRTLLRTDSVGVLAVLSPAALDFDYVAVPWSESLTMQDQDAIAQHTPGRLVLTACDTQPALDWGMAAGVRLYAGAILAGTAAG